MAIPPRDHQLRYTTAAEHWTDALPIGNGRLGAMIFGDPARDRWQINDDTCWSGEPGSVDGVPASDERSPDVVRRVRQLLLNGEVERAEQEIRTVQYGHSQAYQPLADLLIDIDGPETPLRERALHLRRAVAVWRTDDGGCEVFASAPAAAIVGRYRWLTAHDVTLQLVAAHQQYGHARVVADDHGLLLVSRMPTDVVPSHDRQTDDVVRFDPDPGQAITAAAAVGVISDGRLDISGETIRINHATWLQIALTTETDFVDPQTPPHGAIDRLTEVARARAVATAARDFDQLRAEHIEEYRSWFDRFDLRLAPAADRGTTANTDELLARSSSGDLAPELVTDLVQYGRYLMISASRPGSRAMHLQGIWNPWVQPPWSSNYTLNINTEMNYWPATVGNLAECAEPLHALIDNTARTGERTARRVYDRSGWAAHHNTDLWGFSLPVGTGTANPSWAAWPMAGFWLLRQLWEHHQFSGDDEFLITRMWPLLDGAVDFALDTVITLPTTRSPSSRPRHRRTPI